MFISIVSIIPFTAALKKKSPGETMTQRESSESFARWSTCGHYTHGWVNVTCQAFRDLPRARTPSTGFPSTTDVFSYAIGSRNLSANGQFCFCFCFCFVLFVVVVAAAAQTVVSLLHTA